MKTRVSVALLSAVVLMVSGCSMRPPSGVKAAVKTMTVTGYCRCGKCCGWERNWLMMPIYSSGPNKGKRKRVGVTASGSRAKRGTVAADTSVYPMGTIVYVPGYGYGRVEDVGSAIKGQHIDLFFNTHWQAEEWGRQTLKVKVWKK